MSASARFRGLPMPVELRRIDSAKNMRRFYRLDIAPDLFGGFLLLKQWGRIGAGGQIRAERYKSAELAAVALQRHAERKRRRGYVAIGCSHNRPVTAKVCEMAKCGISFGDGR